MSDIDEMIKKADALFELSKHEETLDCVNKILEIEPDNYDALNYKAGALHFLHQYEEEIDCLNRLLEIEPDNASHYQLKGKALFDLSNDNAAIDHMLDMHPEAMPESTTYSFAESLVCFNKALEIDPDNAEALSYQQMLKQYLQKINTT